MRRWLFLIPMLILPLAVACGGGDTDIPEFPELNIVIPTDTPEEAAALAAALAPTLEEALAETEAVMEALEETLEKIPTPAPPSEPTDTPGPEEPSPDPTPSDPDRISGIALLAFEKGNDMMETGQYQQAIMAFQEAIRRHRRPAAILEIEIAHAYLEIGNPDSVVKHLTRALNVENTSEALALRALANTELYRCQDAEDDAQTALTMASRFERGINSHTRARYVLAICRERANDLTTARGNLALALSKAKTIEEYDGAELNAMNTLMTSIMRRLPTPDPSDTESPPDTTQVSTLPTFSTETRKINNRTQRLLMSGNFPFALESAQAAIESHGEPSAELETALAYAQEGLGQHEKTVFHLTTAINLKPDALLFARRAQSFRTLKQNHEALLDAMQSLNMEAMFWEIHDGKARYNTDVEAARLAARIHQERAEYEETLRYANSALTNAVRYGYPPSIIRELQSYRSVAQAVVNFHRGRERNN